MTTIALLLAVAAVGMALARLLWLPVIPVLILVGFAGRFSGILTDEEWIQYSLELGLAFILFFTGLELTPRRAGRQRGAVLRIGPAQFVILGVLAIGLARLLGYDWNACLYFGLGVSASSTLVVLRQLRHRQQMFEPFGRLVMGVLLLQDLAIIFLIVLLVRIPDGIIAVTTGISGLVVLVGLAYICLRWVAPLVAIKWKLDEERLALCIFTILFFFMGLAMAIELPLIAGAFLAGVSLSTFPINGIVRGLVGSLGECFTAIFFTALGAILIIPSWTEIWHAALMIALVLAVTPPLVTYLARRQGLTARASVESGLLLSQTSEISIIIALHGVVIGQIDQQVFGVIVLVTIFTMILTPFIATTRVAEFLIRIHPFTRSRREPLEVKDHALILGFGTGGPQLLRPLQKAGIPVVVVDEDAAVIERLKKEGVLTVMGDAAEERALEQARGREAKAVLVNVRRLADAENILRHLDTSRTKVLVRIFEAQDAEAIKALGGIPMVSSLETSANFMELFEMTDEGREADMIA